MLTAKKLREQTVEELKAQHADLSKEIFKIDCEISIARKLEKPHLRREKKRDKARVLTVLHEKGGAI